MVAEGVGAVVAQVAAVRVRVGLRLAGGHVGGAEDLEGLEDGGEGDLEALDGRVGFFVFFLFFVIIILLAWCGCWVRKVGYVGGE